MHTIERYHDISAGHRVAGHENKCAHLHGHNYRITFVVAADRSEGVQERLDQLGRVVDFSCLKGTLCAWLEEHWDHKMLLWSHDPIVQALDRTDGAGTVERAVRDSLVVVPFNPTAENMAAFLVNHIGPELLRPYGVVLVACTVEETRKCSATYQLY